MPSIQKPKIFIADYYHAIDGEQVVELMNHYALDQMGGGQALTDEVKSNMVSEMAKVPGAFSVLATINGQAAGLINCFMGFSTFKAKPLINIHDVIVHEDFRGLKLSQMMLEKVEEVARQRDCCKLTLEVLQGNKLAQSAYIKFGFAGYALDPEMGNALFWQKAL
jgi:ribosomal protein S18 acetylase RimI-like enzyme